METSWIVHGQFLESSWKVHEFREMKRGPRVALGLGTHAHAHPPARPPTHPPTHPRARRAREFTRTRAQKHASACSCCCGVFDSARFAQLAGSWPRRGFDSLAFYLQARRQRRQGQNISFARRQGRWGR